MIAAEAEAIEAITSEVGGRTGVKKRDYTGRFL